MGGLLPSASPSLGCQRVQVLLWLAGALGRPRDLHQLGPKLCIPWGGGGVFCSACPPPQVELLCLLPKLLGLLLTCPFLPVSLSALGPQGPPPWPPVMPPLRGSKVFGLQQAMPGMTKWTLCSGNKARLPCSGFPPHPHTQEHSLSSPLPPHPLSPLNIALECGGG